MLAIDTNIVVRYLTGDHPEQSPKAKALVDGQMIFVGDAVMLESEWVLRSVYGFDKKTVRQALRAFAGLPTVSLEHPDIVGKALDLTEMDFADALHLGHSSHCDGFVTFDQRLVKAARQAGVGIVREP